MTKLYERLEIEKDYNNENGDYNCGIVDKLNTDDEMLGLNLVIKGIVELLDKFDQDLTLLHGN